MNVNRFDRWATGLSAIAAGPLILAGMLTSVWGHDDSTSSYLSTYLVDPTRSQVSAVLLHFGYLLLLPVVLGLASVTLKAPILRALGLTFGIISLATLPGLLIIDFYDLALVHSLPLDMAVAVEEQVTRYVGPYVILIPTLAGTVLAFGALCLAASRVAFIPWWTSASLFVGVALMSMDRGSSVVVIAIEGCLLTLGLADVGRRLLMTARGLDGEDHKADHAWARSLSRSR